MALPAPEKIAARMFRQQANILAHYATGSTIDQVASHTGCAVSEVGRVVSTLAGSNRQRANDLATAWHARSAPVPEPQPAAPVAEEIPEPSLAIADLLNRAVASEVPKLVRAADRIADLVDQLEKDLAEHEQAAALKAEAAQLQERLDEINKTLGVKRLPAATAAGVDAKAVRAWAAENKVACPTHGRVPAPVVEAYLQAVKP